MYQSTFVRSFRATSIARNLISRRNWSRLKNRSITLCTSTSKTTELESLINLNSSFENLSMARLTPEVSSTPHEAAPDSNTSHSIIHTSDSTSVLDDTAFHPIALPTETDRNILKLCSDMNHAQIKPHLRLQQVANPFTVSSLMLENSTSPSSILSRGLHCDTGPHPFACRKFTTQMNKVEKQSKLDLEKPYDFHEDNDKETLVRAPSPSVDDEGFDKKNSGKQKKTKDLRKGS